MVPADSGRHKVFLGMAAGSGKTYRMLQEGKAEQEAGRDVAVGYLEPHGREETAAQAEGLEILPRGSIEYRGVELEEMDLPGVLERSPELCLIDELAHTNAPGAEHGKRYEDVEQVLDAGIDVFSTLNVQHLESLNDKVTELTGVRVRETMPDEVLKRADEVVLIDLTPEALIERLQAGKIYPEGRIEPALQNFFRIENLAALREVALRQVAEDVEAKRLVRETFGTRDDRSLDTAARQAVGEKLLALVKPDPRGQRIARRAWRSAQRLGSDLDLLWVRPPGRALDADGERELDAMRRLASVLGVRLIVEEGDDVVAIVSRVAAELGTTYILIGTPHRRPLLGRLSEPLPVRLVKELPGIDVRIVADRALREPQAESWSDE